MKEGLAEAYKTHTKEEYKMNGLFGKMFDLNRDGKLDSIERAMDYMIFNEHLKEVDGFIPLLLLKDNTLFFHILNNLTQ